MESINGDFEENYTSFSWINISVDNTSRTMHSNIMCIVILQAYPHFKPKNVSNLI